jgi:hypothetical protein
LAYTQASMSQRKLLWLPDRRGRTCPPFGLDGLVAGAAPLPCPPVVGHVALIVDGRNKSGSGRQPVASTP